MFSLPNNTKILAPFLTAANQLKGPQKSETQEGLLPLFGVCLAKKVVFCKESNVFINSMLVSSLSPRLLLHTSPGYNFNEIEDTLPLSKLYTGFLKTGFKEMLLPRRNTKQLHNFGRGDCINATKK